MLAVVARQLYPDNSIGILLVDSFYGLECSVSASIADENQFPSD
jgi:hypothetical protein